MKKKYTPATFLKHLNFNTLFLTICLIIGASINSFGQGANCATSTALTVNGACGTGTINNAAEDLPNIMGCAGTFNQEGWYSFNVTGGPLDITITATITSRDLFLQLISGACGSGTQIACVNNVNTNGPQTETLTALNLANGTYYIKAVDVRTNGNGSMPISSICVTGTTPCNAPASVNLVTAITTTTATISWPAATPAPASGYQWEVRTTGAGGSGATGLTASGSTAAGVLTANVTGLTANTPYNVYVRSNCGSGFSTWAGPRAFTTLVASSTPPNDLCSNATALGCGVTLAGTTVNSSNLPHYATCSMSNYGVWYTFTGDGQSTTISSTATFDHEMSISSGSCGNGNLTSISCRDNTITGAETYTFNTTVGTQYYVYISHYSSGSTTTGTFTINRTCTAPTYCTSTSTSSTGFIEDFITTGGTTNINNSPTGYSATGYGNYSGMVVTQYQSGTVDFTVDFSGTNTDFGFSIWVDWNNDLIFSTNEEVYGSNGFITGISSSFDIPVNAIVGNHRMRIRSNYWDTTPDPCGSISNGETEDYTLNVLQILCNNNPTNITISAITETTATINWTAPATPPGSGYTYYVSSNPTTPNFNATPTGTTAAGITTANISGLNDGTIYYVWVRSNCGGGNGLGAWQGSETFTTVLAPPVTVDISVCRGNTAFLEASASCSAGGTASNTINGNLDAATDPSAYTPPWLIVSTDPCAFDTSYFKTYTTYDFEVDVSGTYVIAIDASVNFDVLGYIVTGGFTPGTCANGTWIAGDDDSGPGLDSEITANLVTGVTYTLVTTNALGGNITDSFIWNVTGPGSVYESTPNGAIQWFDAAVGGSVIGTGSPFNPVPTGLADTNTPGTYQFWAACSSDPTNRTVANFTVLDSPTANISGSSTSCSGPYDVTVTLTGTGPWTIKIGEDTDGDGNADNVISVPVATSPYTFTATGPVGTIYTLLTVSFDYGPYYCSAIAGDLTGSATVSTGGKTWLGTTNNNWYVASNWSGGTIPNASDCVVIPAGTSPVADITTIPIPIPPDPTALAGTLTIENGATLEIESNTYIQVTDWVQVNTGGLFYIKTSGGLIQINNVSNTINGDFYIERAPNASLTPVANLNYVYWSSPVNGFDVNDISPNSTLKYEWDPTILANGIGHYGDWIGASVSGNPMDIAKGYIVRGLSGVTADPRMALSANSALFRGNPNNGDLDISIYHGDYNAAGNPGYPSAGGTAYNNDDNWNLIGNPYPSAISADAFIDANAGIIDDDGVSPLVGAVWMWPHAGLPSTANSDPFYYNFESNYADQYIKHNRTGTSPPPPGGAGDVFLASGQAFFVLAEHTADPNGADKVVFNNSMRNNMYSNANFYRTNNENTNPITIEKHRIWIDMVDSNNFANTILIGYVDGATNGNDKKYDAPEFEGFKFYSTIESEKYAIQGRSLPFQDSDTVSLGFKIASTGNYTIAINTLDGLFDTTTQDIFLEDTYNGIIHDLRINPYSFNSETGTFDDRFILRYTNNALTIEEFETNAGISILAPNNSYIKVTSKMENIKSVSVYDVLGRILINKQNVNSSELIINNITNSDGVLFVKATLTNGQQKTQKVIIKQ